MTTEAQEEAYPYGLLYCPSCKKRVRTKTGALNNKVWCKQCNELIE